MARRFNTTGPCVADRDYMLPPLGRLPEVPGLVEQEHYFVVHAPRQTGKTTAIRAIAHELTAGGRYAALAFTCESGRAAGDNYGSAQREILSEIRFRADAALPAELRPPAWPEASEGSLVRAALTAWTMECPLPVVLFFDEIDALAGASLYSVLSQLRAGYNERPHAFPSSVGLCGLRDVRDYKAAAGGDPSRLTSSSPFNVLVESLRLSDFTVDEVATLYGQHTADTGQVFTEPAVEYAFELTQGQPWLVNALAREVIEKMGVAAGEAIGPRRLETAKERLIQARATHLDSLAAKLEEPRVQRIIDPVIAGELALGDQVYNDDLSYLVDLGLLGRGKQIQIANPIYREVVLRVLGGRFEANLAADPHAFILDDGRLAFDRLVDEFVAFWKAHGDILVSGDAYHESAPMLVLMAFLHRIVNGGGYVDREYGVGRGRIDLLVRWPYTDASGTRRWQFQAAELKVWRQGRSDPLDDGLVQLDAYLDRLDLTTGHLVIFDRRPDAAPLPERVTFDRATTPAGRTITVLRA